MNSEKERLDVLLIKRGMAGSREKAKELIQAGNVLVDGKCERKAGSMFYTDVKLTLCAEPEKYVSRGGLKLEKAVETFKIMLAGKVCMDVGASTGGFTDCMLQNGAAKVYAVDVGTGQLAKCLQQDSRVISMEKTNIRYVGKDEIGELVDFVSVDVAFISLTLILDSVAALMKPDAEIVCLIKPQFEAGKGRVGKKGVVREQTEHRRVIQNVMTCAAEAGFFLRGLAYSPIRGPEGNIEYLLYGFRSVSGECARDAPDKKVFGGELLNQIETVVADAHNILKG